MNIEQKYKKLLYWFKEISKVPRNSTQEEKIADFICNFATERNLEYRRDNLQNVLIKKKASTGYEGKESIIFQAHTDMVCEKAKNSLHDFEKDAIEIIETAETLTAKDTTLGADDGIGVATLLLLLDDDEIKHPEIYCLFTTQEEIGMDGAKYFDYSGINATYLINVDGEEENTAIVGCAGGVRVQYEKEMDVTSEKDRIYKLVISGLYGGHSGVDINKNRLNSNYLMALILREFENVKIKSFIGGNKDNAIPNRTEAVFSTNSRNLDEIINKTLSKIKLSEEDKNLNIKLFNEEELKKQEEIKLNYGEEKCISKDETDNFLNLLINLKQGVIQYSKDVEGLVESSGNVGIVEVKEGIAKITELIRSSDDNEKENIKNNNNSLAQGYGYKVFENSSYPGWKYKPNTKLEKVYIESYKEVHSMQKPVICAIHAGVECGMIYKKMPHLQMISIGPDLIDVHTINETLYLKSCKTFLETVLKVVEKL